MPHVVCSPFCMCVSLCSGKKRNEGRKLFIFSAAVQVDISDGKDYGTKNVVSVLIIPNIFDVVRSKRMRLTAYEDGSGK